MIATIERTIAKTGRSMKKYAIFMAAMLLHRVARKSAVRWRFLGVRRPGFEVFQVRSDSSAIGASRGFTFAPGSADWVPLTTTHSPGLRPPVIDRKVPNKAPSLTGSALYDTIGSDDEKIPLVLIGIHRRIWNQKRLIATSHWNAHNCKKSRHQ